MSCDKLPAPNLTEDFWADGPESLEAGLATCLEEINDVLERISAAEDLQQREELLEHLEQLERSYETMLAARKGGALFLEEK